MEVKESRWIEDPLENPTIPCNFYPINFYLLHEIIATPYML